MKTTTPHRTSSTVTPCSPARWLAFATFSGWLTCTSLTAADLTPQLTVIGSETNGAVYLEVFGPERSMCVLQSSIDLSSWQDVQSIALRENFHSITLPPEANHTHRFFRVIPDTDRAFVEGPDNLAADEQRAAQGAEIAKAIYGIDNRRDLYQETDSRRREWAAAVCGLVYTDEVRDLGNGTIQLLTSPFEIGNLPPCYSERFKLQPTGPYCTAFLVGPDLVATAGHCYDSDDIQNTSFVFGFNMVDSTTATRVFPVNRVYRGKQVVARELAGSLDFCLIQLDRPVTATDITPLRLRRNGAAPLGTAVGVIGHPGGLPIKLAFGSTTQVQGDSGNFFRANLDTYGENSGSPVINTREGFVEGILVRGETDFELSSGGGCFQSIRLTNRPGNEEVTKSSVWAAWVPEITLPRDIVWIRFDYQGFESGTQQQPYRTVLSAVAAVNPNGILRFEPGEGTARPRIDKPLRLEAPNGTVRIRG
jgi:hypothetical protein